MKNNNIWYKTNFLHNLVDMHIPSGEKMLVNFDPEAYADNMKTAGVDAAYIYASNCLGLTLFPSKYGILHSEAKKRDLFGATVSACKKRGLKVVGYLNSLATVSSKLHPEWNIIRNGKPNGSMGRFVNCCINTPYRQFFLNIVAELCSTYDIDGLWVDMIGYWSDICECPSCKEKFFKLTGRDIPTTVNWHDPEWVEYIRFKEQSLSDYGKAIETAAKTARPGISVGLQCAPLLSGPFIGLDQEFYAAMDYCAGDFYTDRDGVNTISRMLYKLSPDLPFEFMASRCPDLTYHTLFKPIEELIAQACAALMYNGSFLFIDAIDPDGGLNRDFYRRIAKLKEAVSPFIPYIDYNGKAMRDVAVYYNFDSFINISDNGREYTSLPGLGARLNKISQALTRSHIEYDVLSRKNLTELSNYKVLIVPDLPMMNDMETEAIRNYVRDGGNLYLSGSASVLRSDGKLMDNFMLSDVIGADYEGTHAMFPTYVVPADENDPIFGGYTKKYPHMLSDSQLKVKAREDAEVIATVALPYSNSNDMVNIITALSDPPWTYTEYPSVLKNKFGKGKAIYSAGVIENSQARDNQLFFIELIKDLAEDQFSAQLDAHECVDYTVYKRAEKSQYCVGLLNHQNNIPAIPVQNLCVKFKLSPDEKIKNVFSVNGSVIEHCQMENDYIKIKIKQLDLFDMIIVEY